MGRRLIKEVLYKEVDKWVRSEYLSYTYEHAISPDQSRFISVTFYRDDDLEYKDIYHVRFDTGKFGYIEYEMDNSNLDTDTTYNRIYFMFSKYFKGVFREMNLDDLLCGG